MSCGRLLLPAAELAAEWIAASDRPAFLSAHWGRSPTPPRMPVRRGKRVPATGGYRTVTAAWLPAMTAPAVIVGAAGVVIRFAFVSR